MSAAAPAHVQDAGHAWLHAMRAGDFEAAWRASDLIEADRRCGKPTQPWHLRWDGTPVDGRVVRVRCLHGLGDTLQFMRFVPAFTARARRLHFLVQPALLELLTGAPGLGEVSNAWTDDPPAAEMELEVMELAYALRVTARSLPPPYPHLAAHVRRHFAAPHIESADARGLNVGLLWAASDWDPSRSLPLQALAPLFDLPGVCFYSLQQGPAACDPAAEGFGLQPLWRETAEIASAAAALLAMDLVISVDGMPAHLSATLGRPTWLLLKHEADWRWMQQRTDTPWYPTMRLFRQETSGDWTAVVREVRKALDALAPR